MWWLPANPPLAAIAGLLVTAAFLAVVLAAGWVMGRLARLAFHLSADQWKALRLRRFWLVNMAFAPFSLALFALATWALRLTPSQIGIDARHLGMGLAWALPVSAVMGGFNAIVAPLAVRQGIKVMDVEFGRSKLDIVGSIAYMAIFVGPLEEIPFRGIIQTVLMRTLPQAWRLGGASILLGTVVGAAIFVLYHYRNVALGGETRAQFIRQLPGRSLVSLFLALLFQGTGSLIGPVIFHNVIDTCIVAAVAITTYRMRAESGVTPGAIAPEA